MNGKRSVRFSLDLFFNLPYAIVTEANGDVWITGRRKVLIALLRDPQGAKRPADIEILR